MKLSKDGHILIKGTANESTCVKVEGSREYLEHPRLVVGSTFEIPDAFKIQFKHYFEDVYGAQESIYQALRYCLMFEGKPFFQCRVEAAKAAVLEESEKEKGGKANL